MAEPTKPKSDAERFAAMEAMVAAQNQQIAELKAMLKGGAVNAVEVVNKKDRDEWYLEQQKEISKGNVVRTQEEADRRFPKGEHRFRCLLEDGNLHPPVEIRADNEVDAKGRYAAVCGITSHEKPINAVKV